MGDLGNIPNTITYIRSSATSPAVYTPSTQAMARTDTQTLSIAAIKTDFTTEMIDGVQVKPTDQRLLLAGKDIPFEPLEQDRANIDGVIWQIVRVTSDPVEAHWDLQIRKP